VSRKQSQLLGKGIYSVSEAARLTSVNARRIRRWLEGYTYAIDCRIHSSSPVWRRQLPEIDGALALGFLDLMEVRFVDAFRKHGVSLHTIRRAAERAMEWFRRDHPLCTKRFKTDGRSIFAEIIEETGDTSLLDIVKRQYAFEKILAPYLYRGLEFSEEELVRWYPMAPKRRVVIDPERAFGQPIVTKEGVPTSVLAQSCKVEGSVVAVAQWYEVDVRSVRDAVEFEEQLAA